MEPKIKFIFDDEKSLKLKEERGLGFEEIINAIENGKLLEIIPHYNRAKYPHQMVLIVNVNDYAYLVPYVEDGDFIILKTIFPNRKFTKLYLDKIKAGDNS